MSNNASTISGNSAPWGGGIGDWEGTMTISSSTISNNISANSAAGIGNSGTLTIDASKISVITAGLIGGGLVNWRGTLIVTGSAISENQAAAEDDAVYTTIPGENETSITGSCIVGNGDLAVFNDQSVWQDFTNNWWGDSNGPSRAGEVFGDWVSEYVTFTPWLEVAPDICSAP